ncbi:hypothetical protein, partial [Kitasatospora sp. NPDC002040]|uniref:hypothetical protein n=1 Tax=Kitasatospora sp. NPDC002040 TaxID=3154661 RepID=UPI0033245022
MTTRLRTHPVPQRLRERLTRVLHRILERISPRLARPPQIEPVLRTETLIHRLRDQITDHRLHSRN